MQLCGIILVNGQHIVDEDHTLTFPKPNGNPEELVIDYFELTFAYAQSVYSANCVNRALYVPLGHNPDDS